MLCLACAAHRGIPLCRRCRNDLREGPQFLLDGRVLVAAAFHHHGAARRLVHRLKYGGLDAAGRVLAGAMAARLPAAATALVPVPRALSRRIRHGIDPAEALARDISRHTGVPTLMCLRPRLWWPRHATRPPGRRHAVRFGVVVTPPPGAVLIDDVVTSGSTLAAAHEALTHVVHAVAATSPGNIRPGADVDEGGKAHDAQIRFRVE